MDFLWMLCEKVGHFYLEVYFLILENEPTEARKNQIV